MYRVIFHPSPEQSPPPPADDQPVPAEPSALSLLTGAALDLAARSASGARALPQAA